ncbi:hypothetical protein AB0J86_27185 [Micromonospora sp. NPDC049559]|uniref:hypothetical protein n=1 Tax=Micromonospora sp. NPDC049559 TaxID=3155923 RepID=UPI003413F282
MPAAWSVLVLAPIAAFLSLLYATHPGTDGVVAPLRLAAIRAALATGAYAVLVVEVCGALRRLTAPALALAWLLFLLVAALLAARRRRRRPWSPARLRLVARWRAAGRGERLLAGTTGLVVLVDLVIALLAEPNNFDSQTYHLPKIEHWAAQGSLEFWPTAIHRQVTIPPGAEYLLLHLRLLTGGDALYNLLQWAAGIGCLVVATRIVAQLGGGRRAQLLAAFLLATTPMVALQATSTQTDLVAAAWTGCVATLALDGLARRAGAAQVLGLGAATGLTAVTKTSGLLGAGPVLVLWGLAQLRLAFAARPAAGAAAASTPAHAPAQLVHPHGTAGAAAPGTPAGAEEAGTPAAGSGAARTGGRPAVRVLGTAGAALAILAVAAVITGPFLLRVYAEFGNPLGPPRLRESIPMQRHDPASILVNAARIGHTALDTPLAPLRSASASAIEDGAGLIGVDPQDRAITFGTSTFPVPAWYPDEDRVSFPIAGSLALVGGLIALARPRRVTARYPGALRAYAAVVTVAVLLYTATIKWQPWGNRLLLFALVLAAPLAGLWLDALFRGRAGATESGAGAAGPRAGAGATEPGAGAAGTTGPVRGRRGVAVLLATAMLAASALAGVLAISYGFPRRLVGSGSLLTTSDWDTRFLRRPQWADEFRWAAQRVNASGANRIGLVQQNDNWEYPWWLLLRDGAAGQPAGQREIVSLVSVLPDRPPADPRGVDAIVCTGDRRACSRLVPPGWRIEFRDYVGFALPPAAGG